MRRFAKKVARRLLGAGGYTVMAPADLAQLQQNLAETKGGVSAVQSQLGETHSHTIVLRQELAEARGSISALHAALDGTARSLEQTLQAGTERIAQAAAEVRRAGSALHGELRALPRRLDAAAMRCLAASPGKGAEGTESAGLASHFMRSADLVARHWVRPERLPPDLHPHDDLSLDYAVRNNVFVPGQGNEAEVDPGQQGFPWRQLFSDPGCGIFLALGQSNAGNHGETRYTPQREVYSFDFLRMRCARASDPLAGASGNGGSVWSRLGDLLIEEGVFERVLFVPIAFGGAFITDLTPGGSKHRRTALALGRLLKELGTLPLPFSAVLWQQGEAEANHTRMTAMAYQAHLYDIVSDLRAMGVFAPVFVANASLCEAGPHPHDNHEAIRQGQRAVVNAAGGIFPGPDVDTIRGDGRYDGCHLSSSGLQRCAELWLEPIAARRHLLARP